MECFIFKAVEEAVYEVIREKGNNYWNDIQAARKVIVKCYSHGGLSTECATLVPYNRREVRWAYAHLYVTPHIHMVKDIFQRLWHSNEDFRTWLYPQRGFPLKLCCVGGGPGSDILGFAMFLRNKFLIPPIVEGEVLDHFTEWADTFATLVRHLGLERLVLPAGGQGINYCDFDFHKDLAQNMNLWKHSWRVQDADLITMVKFVSAVSENKEDCEKKLTSLLQLLKPGAMLFVLENAGGGYTKIIRAAAINAGLRQIEEINHIEVGLPEHEQESIRSSQLHLPKVDCRKTWKVSALLWQKGNHPDAENVHPLSYRNWAFPQYADSHTTNNYFKNILNSENVQPLSYGNWACPPQYAESQTTNDYCFKNNLNSENVHPLPYQNWASPQYAESQTTSNYCFKSAFVSSDTTYATNSYWNQTSEAPILSFPQYHMFDSTASSSTTSPYPFGHQISNANLNHTIDSNSGYSTYHHNPHSKYSWPLQQLNQPETQNWNELYRTSSRPHPYRRPLNNSTTQCSNENDGVAFAGKATKVRLSKKRRVPQSENRSKRLRL